MRFIMKGLLKWTVLILLLVVLHSDRICNFGIIGID